MAYFVTTKVLDIPQLLFDFYFSFSAKKGQQGSNTSLLWVCLGNAGALGPTSLKYDARDRRDWHRVNQQSVSSF